jgi:hypothetical protein
MKKIAILSAILLSITFSCKNETKLDAEYLNGNWLVQEAFRNEIKTQTLAGANFNFNNNFINTNFTGKDVNSSLVINHKTKSLRLEALNQEFITKIISDKQLELSTTIQGIPFRIIIIKQ